MLWPAIKTRILKRDNYTCHYCGKPADTVDHKFPSKFGGEDKDYNLVACCKFCNSQKGATPYEYYIKYGRTEGMEMYLKQLAQASQ